MSKKKKRNRKTLLLTRSELNSIENIMFKVLTNYEMSKTSLYHEVCWNLQENNNIL